MDKVKVTYIDSGIVKAVIFNLRNKWWNFNDDLSENGIMDWYTILKIEPILEPQEFNIIDKSN